MHQIISTNTDDNQLQPQNDVNKAWSLHANCKQVMVELSNNTTFTWQIPLFSEQDVNLLCSGYTRQHSRLKIPTDIVELFINYFNDSLDLTQIKYAKNEESFKSCIFSINRRFKFEMEICPNGDNLSDIGEFAVFLNLASIPSQINKIDLSYILQLCELNIKNEEKSLTYSRQLSGYRWSEILPLSKIQNLDSLTLKIDIKQVGIYIGEYIKTVNNIYVDTKLYLPIGRYIWNITQLCELAIISKLQIGDTFCSDLFEIESFKWIMKIYKRNEFAIDIAVDLVGCSPNISTICLKYNIEFIELNIIQNGCMEIVIKADINGNYNSFTFWPSKLANLQQNHINCKCCKHITIKLQLTILDVFDKNGSQINNYKQFHDNSTLLGRTKSRFVWNINDSQMVKNMKYAEIGQKFISKCFEVVDSIWCLNFYPKGYNCNNNNNNNNNNDYAALMLNLISLHPLIHCISVCFELIFHQYNIIRKQTRQLYRNGEEFWGWQETGIYVKHLNEFTFECIIHVIDVYDKYGRAISDKYEYWELVEGLQLPTIGYIWQIFDADYIFNIKHCIKFEVFMSDLFVMYGLKWFLQFYPFVTSRIDGESISILNVCLACKPPNISSITFGFTLQLKELNIKFSHFIELNENKLSIDLELKREDILQLEHFTFEIELNLIDIYDQNGNLVTEKYIYDYKQDDEEVEYSQSKKAFDDIEIDFDEIEMAKEVSLKMDNFQWNINEKIMNQIKECKNGSFFTSPVFKINGMKFLMQIAPNDEHQLEWFLYLASIPINVGKVSIFYKVFFMQVEIFDIYFTDFSFKKTRYKWRVNRLQFENILDLKAMKIKIEIGIIDVFDNDGHIIDIDDFNEKYGQNHYDDDDDDEKINHHSMNELEIFDFYLWRFKLENIKFGEYFDSEIFGNCKNIKWKIRFWPNKMFELHLLSMPKDVVAISIYFEIYLIEFGLVWTNCAHFRLDQLIVHIEEKFKIKKWKWKKELTIKAIISIIDIYDDECNVITDR